MVALYLSPLVLDLYMNVFSNHFLLYMKSDTVHRCCSLRNKEGYLCCDKQENPNYPGFCGYSHAQAGSIR